MTKTTILHLFLALNGCAFFIINKSFQVIENKWPIQLWGFGMWLYLFVSLVQAMDAVMRTKCTNKQNIVLGLNMFSQIGVLLIFTYTYVLPVSDKSLNFINKNVLSALILLIITEVISSLFYRNRQEKYGVNDGYLDSDVVQNHVYNTIIKSIKLDSIKRYLKEEKSVITEAEKERVEISVKNVFSFVFIVLISLILKTYMSFTEDIYSTYLLAAILIVLYVSYNFKKYKFAVRKIGRFYLDMAGSILSVFSYVFLESYNHLSGFPNTFLAIYFLPPLLPASIVF